MVANSEVIAELSFPQRGSPPALLPPAPGGLNTSRVHGYNRHPAGAVSLPSRSNRHNPGKHWAETSMRLTQLPTTARLAIGLSLCAAFCSVPWARAQKVPPASTVAALPVIDLPGFQKIIASYRGKPLMVVFWATWCEPCHVEYPMVNELARQYMTRGLAAVGISLDEDADLTPERHFLERTRPVFPNYRKRRGDEDAFNHAVSPSWSGSIPATFFYAPDGRLVTSLVGDHPQPDFEKAIEIILKKAPTSAPAPGANTREPEPSSRRR